MGNWSISVHTGGKFLERDISLLRDTCILCCIMYVVDYVLYTGVYRGIMYFVSEHVVGLILFYNRSFVSFNFEFFKHFFAAVSKLYSTSNFSYINMNTSQLFRIHEHKTCCFLVYVTDSNLNETVNITRTKYAMYIILRIF